MTDPAKPPKDYQEFGVPDLVKMVNDEYSHIYHSDRMTYPRAITVGEMLNNLKPRVSNHGKWQDWLKSNCPKISLETANLYMRLADSENQTKIASIAAGKSVSVTDLTITKARELLAKPKANNNTSKGKFGKSTKAAVEPGNQATSPSLAPEEALKDWAADELFSILKDRDPDDLKDLTTRLAAHLRMTLTPIPSRPTTSPATEARL